MIEQINKIAEIWWSWMWPMFWQAGVLIVLLGVVDLVIRRRIWPQLRYALWLLVLVKLVLPPTFSLSTSLTSQLQPLAEQVLMRQTGIGGIATVPNLERDLTTAKPLVNTSIEPSVISQETGKSDVLGSADREAGIVAPAGAVKPSRHVYVMLVWLLGTLILATWLVVKLRQLRGPHRGKAEEDALPPWFGKLLADTAEKLNLRRLPEVAFSETVVCPAVFGIFRPVLLLPKGNINGFSRKDTEHILLHELAHIKRGDLWVHSVYMVLQVVYWFNPMLWFVRRQLRHLRELCCDATVAGILQEKTVDYRQTILENARRFLAKTVEPGMGLLGLFEDSNRLLNRLKWLEKKTWKYYRLRSATILAVVALMLACVLPMAKATKGEAAVAPGGIEVVEGTVKAVATKPQPRDGTTTGTTVSKLKWKPGVNAKSHKIYFGTQTNQLPLLAEVKSPSYDELPELEEGTRYYWFVNEVWADGTVITGDVWSFWIPPRNAYNPFPADDIKFVDQNVELSWAAGFRAKMHTVYIGDNFDDVNNATGGLPQIPSVYVVNILELDKTYYWRVDGILADGSIVKGDVWSFKTLPEISVTDPNLVGWWKFDGNANDSSGNGNNGTEKGDPTYVAGKIGQAISFDGLGDRIEVHATFAGNPELFPAKAISVSAWVRSTVSAWALCSLIRHEFHFTPLQTFANSAWANAFTDRYGSMGLRRSGSDWSKINDGKWHHYAVTYNNGIHEVWIDGTKEVSNYFGPFPLWTGDDQPWVFGGKERGEGDGEYYPGELDDVRIYNYALSEKEIEMLCRVKAIKPHPSDDTTIGLTEMPELSWVPAIGATSHRVYGGVEPDELKLLGETTESHFSKLPDMHKNMVYYWRVDGILADGSIVKGDVWKLSIGKLVGWWKFDGNANDSSGNGNNGTEKGDPTYVAGKIGQAISFDGLSDRIEVHATLAGNPELFPAKAISVSAWVRSTVPASALCSLIRHEFHFTPLQTFADSAWATAFTDQYGSRALRRTGSDWSKINDGKWHYYAVTYNNGIHEVWIDGTKEVSSYFGPFPLWTGDDQPWVFGGKERGEGGGEYYPGELDDVRIYNYALSKGEITTLHNEGK